MLKYENKILFILITFLSFTLILFTELQLSPDSKTFLRVSKNISNIGSIIEVEEPLYLASYLIFKIISLTNNFEFCYKLLNVASFFLILIYSKKILFHFDIKFKNYTQYFFYLALFFFNFEMLQWTRFALTDLLLISLMMMSAYYFLKNRYTYSILIFLLALLLKPQSVFILFILLFLFFYKKRKNFLFFSLYSSFYILLISIFFIIINFDYNLNFYIFNVINYIFIETLYDGNIVDDRYYIEFENFFSIFKVYFLRFISLFSIYFEQYSFIHKLYKVVYFTFIFLPIITFIYSKNKFNRSFLNFSFGCLSVISIFHNYVH